eukprot:COSAG06_NODE_533_length_14542_cov_17.021325_10_plen_685_part_00
MGLEDNMRSDMLNKNSWLDIDMHTSLEGPDRVNDWDSTCVECPDCLDCSGGGSDWSDIKVKEGYGLAAKSVPDRTHVGRLSGAELTYLDVFKCPLEGACLADLTMADILRGRNRACGTGYDGASTSPLCAICDEGYTRRGRECLPCDEIQGGSIAIVVVMISALIVGVLSTMRLRSCVYQIQVGAALLRLMWPQITQSASLLITNYQILSGLPERIRIPFPDGITILLKAMTTLIDIDVLNLPGLACIIGSDFYTKFMSNMLVPLFIVLAAHALSKYQLRRFRAKTMPLPKALDVDLDSIGPIGSTERRKIVLRTINFKICRAVVGSKIQAPYYSFTFFVVSLRFPAVSRLVFDMFRCRHVEAFPTVKLLEADYQQECFELEHRIFFCIGVIFLFAYTLGIPCFVLYKLTSYKTTILGRPASEDYKPAVGKKGTDGYQPQIGEAAVPGNPGYIDVAPYKSLFAAYKPDCFRFEMYFWIQKVLLVGFTEMAGSVADDSTGITQWLLNLIVMVFYLLLATRYYPYTSDYENRGNIIMQVFIVYFYVVSLLLNPRVNLQDSAIDNIMWIDASLVATQCSLFLYFLHGSLQRLPSLWVAARSAVVAEQEAEALVEEHVQHFEHLRVYFSDPVAIALTNAHHFGAIIDDIGEHGALGKALSETQRNRVGKSTKEVEFMNPVTKTFGNDE